MKPCGVVVATEDDALDPKLLRKTATRISAEAVEAKGSHVVLLGRPDAVADVIDKTASRKTK